MTNRLACPVSVSFTSHKISVRTARANLSNHNFTPTLCELHDKDCFAQFPVKLSSWRLLRSPHDHVPERGAKQGVEMRQSSRVVKALLLDWSTDISTAESPLQHTTLHELPPSPLRLYSRLRPCVNNLYHHKHSKYPFSSFSARNRGRRPSKGEAHDQSLMMITIPNTN